MDLNGLKNANDSFGHAAGDELICAAADCMKNSFSEHSKVYRVGGDEFVVIITKDILQFENILSTFDQRVAGRICRVDDGFVRICLQFREEMEEHFRHFKSFG